MILVYDKQDDPEIKSAQLQILHGIFVDKSKTGDYQTTRGILEILERNGNRDDLAAFLEDRNLPVDDVGRDALAERILNSPPELGYLTISNALQWRVQYGRVIVVSKSDERAGIEDLLNA